jgi:hypothetical protein
VTSGFEKKTVDLFERFFRAHGWTSEVHSDALANLSS